MVSWPVVWHVANALLGRCYGGCSGNNMCSLCFTGTPLTLRAAVTALLPVSHKWFNIGLELDVTESQLKIIETDRLGSEQQMRTMLDYWLNNATDPLPSWKVLVDALKAPTVCEKKLARKLEERYCNPEDQNSLGESDD